MTQGPIYSEFPLSEYVLRVERARREMNKLHVDALLLTAKESLRYFAGGPLTELFIDTYNTFFIVENNVAITADGYELLTPMPDALWIVEA